MMAMINVYLPHVGHYYRKLAHPPPPRASPVPGYGTHKALVVLIHSWIQQRCGPTSSLVHPHGESVDHRRPSRSRTAIRKGSSLRSSLRVLASRSKARNQK